LDVSIEFNLSDDEPVAAVDWSILRTDSDALRYKAWNREKNISEQVATYLHVFLLPNAPTMLQRECTGLCYSERDDIVENERAR